MIGLQIINLFLEDFCPKVLTYKLYRLQMVSKTRPLLICVSSRDHIKKLK